MVNAIPSWLDSTFLTKVLQSLEETKEEIELVNFQCNPAVPPGTNYLSTLYRINTDYKMEGSGVKSKSLIVKTPLESGGVKDFIEKANGYKKELKMYSEILPKMYEISPNELYVTPKSYFCPLHDSLVLEDMKVCGYIMKDRLQQLDFAHCQRFMVSLAGLHALSVAAHRNYPKLIETAGEHLFFNDRCPQNEQREKRLMCDGSLKATVATLKELGGCEKYAGMLNERIESFWEDMVKLVKPRNGLNVLNHGDTWTTNVLFKYNKAGEVTDAKFIDFQLIHFTSFAFDILYFWWTSANEEVREHHREELFEIYRKTLNKNLAELHCSETLTKEDFELEMRASAPYSIFVVSHMLPWAMADPEGLLNLNEGSIDDFISETFNFDTPQWKNYKNKYIRNILPKTLKQMEEFGAFT